MATSPMPTPGHIWFGAAYYHEYTAPGSPRDLGQLHEDMDLMKRSGVSLIRVGESVWSTWEPEDGRFDLEWLEPVLDAAAERNIAVLLGTPTYALPMWLARKHPDIAAEVGSGQPMGWGSRQEMDFTHPAFRFHAERVIRRVVERYGAHRAVVGVQVDNEPGLRLLHNRRVFDQFVEALAQQYGSVERLNDEWGLVYWSHRLTDWSELWLPDGNLQPQYDLAWRRFQARLVTEYIEWQAGLVREVLAEKGVDRFVTTCISYDQVAVADVDLSAALDVAAGNVYYTMQDGLAHPSDRPMSPGWIVEGAWAVYQLADLAWSSKQSPFLVTETNAAAIGFGSINVPGYDGQWRQVAWALVSRGARAIEYWHWKTLHYGAETYWGGVLPHDGRPGRVHAEIARIGAELEQAGAAVADLTPDADVAFLYSSDAKWALSAPAAAPLATPDGTADSDSYRSICLPFYRGAFDAGLQVNTVRPEQLFGHDGGEDPADFARRRPVLVVAGYYPAHDGDLAWLERYIVAGGHLILGPRSAYADPEARARTSTQPAGLAEAAGARYQEFETLRHDVPITCRVADSGPLPSLRASGPWFATRWLDYLQPAGSEVLAGFDDAHRGRWAAVTTRAHGAGRVTVVATVPNGRLAEDLMRWAVPAPAAAWPDLPASVRVTSARRADGAAVLFVHHWGHGEVTVTVPEAMSDVLGTEKLAAGTDLVLGPWDVRVLHVDHDLR